MRQAAADKKMTTEKIQKVWPTMLPPRDPP